MSVAVKEGAKRLRVDEPLPLGRVASKQVEAGTLFIDPEIPSWIALRDREAEAFRLLTQGIPVGHLFRSAAVLSKEETTALLAKVVQAGFLGNRPPPELERRPTKRIQIHLTNRCNLRCTHCYMDSGVTMTPEVETERWCELLEQLKGRYGTIFLSLSGGEPLISPSLLPVLRKAKSLGNVDTGVLTNGLLLKGSLLDKIAPLLDVCAVSLDGLSSTTHDQIRGTGTFEKTVANLSRLADCSFRKVLNITVLRSNRIELVERLYEFVESLPFDVDVDLGTLILEGRGIGQAQLGLSSTEFREFLFEVAQRFVLEAIDDEATEGGPRARIRTGSQGAWKPLPMRRRVSCGYGDTLSIYSNGDLSPCLTPIFIRGNVFDQDVNELLDSIEHERVAARVDALPECRTCVLRYVCGGRCHLPQLRTGKVPSQVECPSSYKESMFRNLAALGSS